MIRKIPIDVSDQDAFLNDIYNKLKENCEGTLFDSVTMDHESTISCEMNDTEVLLLAKYSSAGGFGKVTLPNGKTVSLFSQLSNFNANEVVYADLYITDAGIAITIYTYRGGTSSSVPILVTVIISNDGVATACANQSGSYGKKEYKFATFDSTDYTLYDMSEMKKRDRMALIPIVSMNGAGTVSDSVFITPFSTKDDLNTIQYLFDGASFYVYDGFLALKD